MPQCGHHADGRDLALNGKNAYAASGVPDGLLKALKELNDEGEFIDDVQLTEGGRWLILYGDNGFRWNDIPASLEKKLREYNENEEVVTSVTFNDKGGWIIISTEHISASNTGVYDWIEEGMDKYGALWAAHMTNEALILCYENGFRHSGNIPEKVKRKLGETNILEKILKEYYTDLDGLALLLNSEVVSSVCFNDDGNWILISNERVLSSPDFSEAIEKGTEQNGEVLTAYMTNDSFVVCYEKGITTFGEIPEKVHNMLKNNKFTIYRLKFLPDGAYFIADKDGTNYDYYM